MRTLMDIKKVDHVGIAVTDLASALTLYTDIMGLKVAKIEEFEDLGVKVAFIPVGDILVELVQPLDSDTVLAKRIEMHGEGLYHIAYLVKDIDQALDEFKKNAVKMRDNEPRPAMGSRIAFTTPDSTNNVMIELVERPANKNLI